MRGGGRIIPAYLCAQAIKQGLSPAGQVLLVGDQASEQSARAIGLRFHQRWNAPLGKPDLLARRVRRYANTFDRVICWNDELATLLRGISCPTDLISTRPDLAKRRVPSRVLIRAFERSDRSVWESRNNQAELDTVLHKLVDRPVITDQHHTRTSLGIDPNTICIGMISDRPSDIDARAVGFLMGLLDVSGYSLTAVVPNGANHLTAARRHHHGLGNHFRFLIAQDPIISMLPIFDVLIHPCYNGSGASSLIERLCENLDTPVLRLTHGGRAGLSRAPGLAGPVIEALDGLIATHAPDPIRRKAEIHV